MGMRICGQNPRTDADATFMDLHISGLWRESSVDLRVWFGLVRFGPEQICAVTDSVSEQQRSVCSISILDIYEPGFQQYFLLEPRLSVMLSY